MGCKTRAVGLWRCGIQLPRLMTCPAHHFTYRLDGKGSSRSSIEIRGVELSYLGPSSIIDYGTTPNNSFMTGAGESKLEFERARIALFNVFWCKVCHPLAGLYVGCRGWPVAALAVICIDRS